MHLAQIVLAYLAAKINTVHGSPAPSSHMCAWACVLVAWKSGL